MNVMIATSSLKLPETALYRSNPESFVPSLFRSSRYHYHYLYDCYSLYPSHYRYHYYYSCCCCYSEEVSGPFQQVHIVASRDPNL